MSTNPPHLPVLLNEAVTGLNLRPGGIYVDATFGRGGHSAAILQHLGPGGRLIAVDRDPQAEDFALKHFGSDSRFTFIRSNFARLGEALAQADVQPLNGLLLDCGVSSPQLDDAGRGFSFLKPGPLDMRMDPTSGVSAAAWLAGAGETQISQVLKQYGEERFHRQIAKAIVTARQHQDIDTTSALADLVMNVIPIHKREKHKHPATRTFQAIRLIVNQELESLQSVLAQTPSLLAPHGRLAVIAFHSLEDRIVKQFMRRQSQGKPLPADLPLTSEQARLQSGATMRLVGKAQRPSTLETQINPRARSATLRIAERLP